MNRTKIDWVKNPDGTQGYTWNPITGCLNHTNGMCNGGGFPCYAYLLANGRLKPLYLANTNVAKPIKDGCLDVQALNKALQDPFYPRFWLGRVLDLTTNRIKHHTRDRRGIFVCDMSDWCGIGIPGSWSNWVIEVAEKYPKHRFYLLTKQPQNLIKFSPFPDNCWVGVTITESNTDAGGYLMDVKAKVKFISFEPLLRWANKFPTATAKALKLCGVGWVIIGAQTKPYKPPELAWVEEIISACCKADIPYFLKDNLAPIIPGHVSGDKLHQEMPEGR